MNSGGRLLNALHGSGITTILIPGFDSDSPENPPAPKPQNPKTPTPRFESTERAGDVNGTAGQRHSVGGRAHLGLKAGDVNVAASILANGKTKQVDRSQA